MRRISINPRDDWRRLVEAQGLLFHTADGEPYWDESAYYAFGAGEVDLLERATYRLNEMCLAAVEHVIKENLFRSLDIPAPVGAYVARSWEVDEHTIYGRFDLAFDGVHPPKLLEYNADTPTALLEAAVIQWSWLKDQIREGRFDGRHADQFNSIHERLIEAWRAVGTSLGGTIFFASLPAEESVEDFVTASYLRDTALQAGLDARPIAVAEIGWNHRLRTFVDLQERPIPAVFKLYPWEWMVREQFGRFLPVASTRWLEPPWKMVLSNKGLLPILFELFPDDPHLLRAEFEPFGDTFVVKPVHSREGMNISVIQNGQTLAETGGFHGEGPRIYQEYCPLAEFDGRYPVVGSWIVNGYACGIGIREDDQIITQNTSRFVPHVFER